MLKKSPTVFSTKKSSPSFILLAYYCNSLTTKIAPQPPDAQHIIHSQTTPHTLLPDQQVSRQFLHPAKHVSFASEQVALSSP